MRGTGLRTDYVSDSWDPEFKEIINYEFFDDTPEVGWRQNVKLRAVHIRPRD